MKNLRIDGINEEKGETWKTCETKVKNIFQEQLDIIIERAHRTKKNTLPTWNNER